MVFSSYEFIFIFLPLALAGYFGLRLVASKSITLLWLIGASLTFYAVWDPWNLLVLFGSIGVNFSCGTYLSERVRTKKPTGLLLAAGIAFNLALIGYFKYSGFFATNLNAALERHLVWEMRRWKRCSPIWRASLKTFARPFETTVVVTSTIRSSGSS